MTGIVRRKKLSWIDAVRGVALVLLAALQLGPAAVARAGAVAHEYKGPVRFAQRTGLHRFHRERGEYKGKARCWEHTDEYIL